jgi:hypothetical protein
MPTTPMRYTLTWPGGLTDDAGTVLTRASHHVDGRGEITREDVSQAFAAALRTPPSPTLNGSAARLLWMNRIEDHE